MANAIRTYRNYPRWVHPNTVFSLNVGVGAFHEPLQHEKPGDGTHYHALQGFAPFTINQGDHVLVCHAGIPESSGHKFADYVPQDGSATAFPDTPNRFHISAHDTLIRKDDTDTHRLGHVTLNTGYESRSRFVYFDRENWRGRVAVAVQDGAAPYGPPVFAGMQSFVGKGTDIGLGEIEITELHNYNWHEEGPIHIIRWTAGNAPPLAVIETAMEWMWYEWSLRDNFVLYPPLVNWL